MAHLIRLTDYQTREPVLYNLDTVVQIERMKDHTIITTRWGSLWLENTVVESLEYIEKVSKGEQPQEAPTPF